MCLGVLIEFGEAVLSSQCDRGERRSKARGGKKIYSNCAGVTFSHNPFEMPPVSGDREAGRWREEERWEAPIAILLISMKQHHIQIFSLPTYKILFCRADGGTFA